MIAIGVGASSRAREDDLASAIEVVRREVNGGDLIATFENAMFVTSLMTVAAARSLAFRPVALEMLRQRSGECISRSERSLERFGVASIAEAAALAAAGPCSRLVMPRRIIGQIAVAAAQSDVKDIRQ
jgi:cobalt-precorrin 5A hydrolase